MSDIGAILAVVETSECVIAYRETGAGPALLCLHQGSPGADGWGSFGRASAALGNRFRVVVPDQPGFGASRIAANAASAYQAICARAMAELLEALGLERAQVVGNSLGGGVALLLALDHPDVVDRLVLVAPWTAGVACARASLLPPAVELLQAYYPDPSQEKMRALVRALAYETEPADEQTIAARYRATLEPEHTEGFLRTMRDWPEGIDEKLAGLDHEALLLWGLEDVFCPIEDALRYLELLRNSRLVLFPRCGHSVHLERPTEFRTQICSFLQA